ncbi:hypothetical protein ID866_1411 [Astraeus odoratus]|nr:hypothetical protein ID866_1411 [Astraeus odoratus]
MDFPGDPAITARLHHHWHQQHSSRQPQPPQPQHRQQHQQQQQQQQLGRQQHPPPPRTVTHEFDTCTQQNPSHLPFPPRPPPPPPPPQSMSQPSQPSFPPGSGPNDPHEQHAHYPPGHAYRRSHSNSPFRHTSHPSPYPIPSTPSQLPPLTQTTSPAGIPSAPPPPPPHELKQEAFYSPSAAELYSQAMACSSAGLSDPQGHFANGVTRLPPILQVEKKQVTTSATQAASASRRRNEAHFICPVPGCGSTFTRRFNLRGGSSFWPVHGRANAKSLWQLE